MIPGASRPEKREGEREKSPRKFIIHILAIQNCSGASVTLRSVIPILRDVRIFIAKQITDVNFPLFAL
jgi:hypothetical protein